MAKDYKSYSSRKKKATTQTRRKKTQSTNKFLWVLVVVFVILFAAGLYWLNHKASSSIQAPETVVVTSKVKPKPVAKKASIKYEFYNLLSKSPEVSNHSTKEAQTVNAAASAPNFYILQVASLKKLQDADSLKAKLILNGFNVQIKKTTSPSGTIWHRVQVGPFGSLDAANNAQRLLKQNNINGIIRKQTNNR